MKKTYEAPKVEKMAFNYSDAVVASTPPGRCWNRAIISHWVDHCNADITGYEWVDETANG